MKLGFSSWGMPNVPVDHIIASLAEMGYDGVELTVKPGYSITLDTLDEAYRKYVVRLLDMHNLELPALACHQSLVEQDPDLAAECMRRLKGTVDLAVDWARGGTPPCLDTTTGGNPDDWEPLRPLLEDRLGDLCGYAAERGVVIAIEPHVGTMLDTPPRVVELVDSMGFDNLRVNFDISHFNVMGIDIETSVSALAPLSAHTHVKDERGMAPGHEFLIPGEGVFDYVTYLKAMHRHGYTGFISAEISVMVQRREGYDAIAAAQQTYDVLDAAFREAGIDRG
jgi:sugar phosphate isomerase/epimerase